MPLSHSHSSQVRLSSFSGGFDQKVHARLLCLHLPHSGFGRVHKKIKYFCCHLFRQSKSQESVYFRQALEQSRLCLCPLCRNLVDKCVLCKRCVYLLVQSALVMWSAAPSCLCLGEQLAHGSLWVMWPLLLIALSSAPSAPTHTGDHLTGVD